MTTEINHKHHHLRRRKMRVWVLLLILLGVAILAYIAVRLSGCGEYAYLQYNPQYYEPKDLERGEAVKETQKETLEKLLKRLEQEDTLKYSEDKETTKAKELLDQKKKEIIEALKKLEEEERHKTIWESNQ